MKQIIFKYLMSKQWFLHLVMQRCTEVIADIEYNEFAEGCGLEDQNIEDRYEAMRHGWENAIDSSIEAINNVA
jgi:hypothetical protein